jgi:hypothetical protein
MKLLIAVTSLFATILGLTASLSFASLSKDTEITAAVRVFAENLTTEERAAVTHPFDDSARTQWTNLPVGMVRRPGIRFGALSSASKTRLHHVLTTLLSSQGYLKVLGLMNMDDALNEIYEKAHAEKQVNDDTYDTIRDLDWGFENYFVSVWGTPGSEAPWGFKFEGHHISINCTSDGSDVVVTPLFLGDDQAEVTESRYSGLRVMSKEEDYAFRFLQSLSEEQRTAATLSGEVPSDIITNPKGPRRLEKMQGLAINSLSTEQRVLFRLLISEFVDNLEYGKREEYWKKFEKGQDQTHLAWIGSHEPHKPHYYLIHGPEILIEYDNISWDKEGVDHIHTIMRDVSNDFGEDLLRAHYSTDDHH